MAAIVAEADLELADGRTLHYYDTRAGGSDTRLPVFWQHGTPNLGSPPEPLFPAAAANGRGRERPALGVLRPARLRRLEPGSGPRRRLGRG
jgi:hypothetical protein